MIHRAGKDHANGDTPSRYPLQLLGDNTGAQLDPLSAEEMQKQLETYSAESKRRQAVQQRWADSRKLYTDKADADENSSAAAHPQPQGETTLNCVRTTSPTEESEARNRAAVIKGVEEPEARNRLCNRPPPS